MLWAKCACAKLRHNTAPSCPFVYLTYVSYRQYKKTEEQLLLPRCKALRQRFSGDACGWASGFYKTFSLILENYPTLTRVSASLKRSPACSKKLRFPFAQVGALGQFCSVLRIALEGNFWVQNACQSGVIF